MGTILLVEDDPANMRLAVALVESAGHCVIDATNAETGQTLARRQLPQLILMDIRFPGMDGLEATGLLKQDEATRGEGRIRAAGCDGDIATPLDYQDSLAVIAARLEASANRDPAPPGASR
jgi:two-component system cell cycle response regulator DivK